MEGADRSAAPGDPEVDVDPRAADADPAPPSAARTAFRGYVRRLHVEVVIVQAVIIGVLAGIGWSLRPQSQGFHAIPRGLTLLLVRPSTVAGFDETIVRATDGAVKLSVAPNFTATPYTGTPRAWEFDVYGIGSGRPCSSGQRFTPTQSTHPNPASESASTHFDTVRGVGAAEVEICWTSGAPLDLSGSYLSAVFPPITGGGHSAAVDRTLIPNAGDLANYSIQSTPPPSHNGSASWGWDLDTNPAVPLRVAAVNTSRNQTESYRTFVSGILFGVVGAGLIALLTELLWPLSRRRDETG